MGCHSEALVDPHAVVRAGGEGYCQAGVPKQAVFARVFREELQSELTLVREHSMLVGSGAITYITFLALLEFLFIHFALSSLHILFSNA